MRATVFFILAGAALAQEQNGAIEGVVVDSASRMPIRKAQVMLSVRNVRMPPPRTGMPPAPPPPKSAITDANGAFSFYNLPSGQYDIQVHHRSYPMPRTGMPRQTVVVKPGEKAERLTFELIPGAAVSGRVVDEDGDPVTGCFVQVRPPRNDMVGGANQGSEPTNENGEYRVWGIQPGKYIVATRCVRPVFQPRPLSAGPPPPPSLAYAPQFYRLAVDTPAAEVIVLDPGSEKTGVDFRLTIAPVYTVRGSLTSIGVDWRGRDDLNINLVPRDPSLASLWANRGLRLDRATGTFEIQGVFPGSYMLLAHTNDAEKRIGARQALEVLDRPLQVNLELHPAIDLAGVIEFEGEKKFPLSQVALQVMPVDQIGAPSPSPTRVENDGTFTIRSLLPAVWRIQVFGMGAFMRSMWLGNQELKERVIDTSAGAAGPLRIVLSTNTATIRGTGAPAQSIHVVSASDDPTFGPRQFHAEVNERGEFIFSGLAPGRYRVYAGTPGPPDEGGQEVTAAEGETVRVDLKQQPAQLKR